MIYFIQAGHDGPIKIGFTEQKAGTRPRIDNLQCGNHLKLNLLSFCVGGKSKEKFIHDMFSKERIRGEWFWPTESVLSFALSHVEIEEPNVSSSIGEAGDLNPIRSFIDGSSFNCSSFAKKAGISRQSLYRIMDGRQSPSTSAIISICRASGNVITPNDVVSCSSETEVSA